MRIDCYFGRVILILAFCTLPVTAQNFQVRHFTERDGLTSSAVRCIFKDSQGLIWIGTDAALCTYDGSSFTVVKTPENKTLDKIWSIDEDKNGNLWFGSNLDGIYLYNGYSYKRITTDNGLSTNQIRYLYYSKRFDLIAACSDQGAQIIRGDSVIRSPKWMGSADQPLTLTKAADAEDYIYFTSIGQINPTRYYPDQNRFVNVNDKGSRYPEAAVSVWISSGGDTVFGEYPSGVTIINPKGKIRNPSPGQVFYVDEDRQGNFWMASWSYKNRDLIPGVFRYDGKDFVNYKDQLGIRDRSIWTVYCDREQDVNWIGTENDGLYWFRTSEISESGPAELGLEELSINQLYVDSRDNLWVSDNLDLIRISPDGRKYRMEKTPMIQAYQDYWKETRRNIYVATDSVQKKLRTLPAGKFSDFSKNTPFEFGKVIEDADGTIFFSNRFGLFSLKDQKTDYHGPTGSEGTFRFGGRDTMVFAGWGPTLINPCLSNQSANLTGDGPVNTSIEGAGFIQFNKRGDPRNINRIVSHNGCLWFASWTTGLWMSRGMRLVHFNESDPSIDNNIADLGFDKQGHLIFASGRGEICIAEVRGDSINILWRINSSDGIRGSTLNWIRIGPDDHLWAGTNLGLNCIDLQALFDKKQTVIRFFDNENGYNGQGSLRAAMDSRGILYVAGENSLIRVNTSGLLATPDHKGKVILRELKLNGEAMPDRKLREINKANTLAKIVRINPKQSDFIFGFDNLNYINSGKDLYRYKLGGYDERWSEWSQSRQAVYTNLPNGNYLLIVESYNISTLVGAEPLSVKFVVPPSFWQRWYNQVLAFMFIVGMIFIATIRIVDQKRLRQISQVEMKRKVLELEMKALQNQMNPHFVYNTLSGIQHSILEQNTEEAMGYISDFSKVMRISLENASSTFILLSREIEFLNSYLRLEQMRFPGLFDFQIGNLTEPSANTISIPSMVIQPFAENSIRHGFRNLKRKGLLTIGFEMIESEVIKCTITDNGNGRVFNPSRSTQQPQSDRVHSTAITAMRIQLFNQPGEYEKYKVIYTDLSDTDGPCGLRVELILPVK